MSGPVVLGPRRLRTVCRLVAGLVVAVFAVIAAVLPRGSAGGRQFGPADQALFLGLGLALAGAVLAFTRFRVRADGSGVWVRNVLRERWFPWGVVEAVVLDRDGPWAELRLHDDQRVALLALQAHDGELAVTGARALEELRRGHGGAAGDQAPDGPSEP